MKGTKRGTGNTKAQLTIEYLAADGFQNNVQTMLNTLFAERYGSHIYSSAVSTRLSNALLVGAVLGQVSVGVVCDRIGRKSAIVLSTVLLTLGAIFATAAVPVHGNVSNLWWWLTIARGAIGVGVGGEWWMQARSVGRH